MPKTPEELVQDFLDNLNENTMKSEEEKDKDRAERARRAATKKKEMLVENGL